MVSELEGVMRESRKRAANLALSFRTSDPLESLSLSCPSQASSCREVRLRFSNSIAVPPQLLSNLVSHIIEHSRKSLPQAG